MFEHPESAAARHKLNREIEALLPELEKRNPTTQELEFISGYTGGGGLGSVGVEGAALLQEFYTPNAICELMWKMLLAADYFGNNPIKSVLEPSVGTGRLLQHAPASVEQIVGYELNPISAKICQLIYPKPTTTIYTGEFEQRFYDGYKALSSKHEAHQPAFDAVISNPPYGTYTGKYAGLGEKKATGAETFDEYFILRSMQLVKPGGYGCFIIGATKSNGGKLFLEKDIANASPAKKFISENYRLADAIRTPAGIFTGTEVSNEIILLEKPWKKMQW